VELFTIVCTGKNEVVPLSRYPVKFSFSVVTQEKVVFSTSETRSTWVDSSPEHISCSVIVFVIVGC